MIRKSIIKGFIIKEFKQMLRDFRMRIVLFGAPIIMLLLFGYAVSTDVKYVNMAILDEDKSHESRELIEKFTASGYFIPYADLGSAKEMDILLDNGHAEMYMHIGPGFSKAVKSGKSASIQLIVDGTDSSRAAVIVAYVNQITSGFSFDYFRKRIMMDILARQISGVRMKQTVELKERIQFNPDLASRNYFLPGILGLIISMVTIVMTAMSIVKERETGTIEQIVVSPVTPIELIAGKTIPFVIVSFADTIIITLLMIFWFQVPFHGSFIFLLFIALIFVFSTTSIGLFISTISKTQQQALLSVFLYFLPAIMFSGFAFPIFAMPDVMQWVTYINPMRYFITIVRGIFLKGVGINVLWPDMLALAAIGAALFYFSTQRFRRRME